MRNRTRLGGLTACLATTTIAAAGCGDYKAPTTFAVSDAAVSDVVTQAINNARSSPGLAGSPTVTCDGETSCDITYTIKEPGGFDNDLELIEPTRQIWKAMFEDRAFDHGKIEVDGPLTSVGGQSSTGALLTLECDRAAASQIDWDNVDGKGIRTLCTYTAKAKL